MLEEEKELLEERVRELTVQLEQAQTTKVSLVSGVTNLFIPLSFTVCGS